MMITASGIEDLSTDALTRTFTMAFIDSKGRVTHETNMGTNSAPPNVPVPRAFKPVEDICASGVVDLVKRVSVGLLDGHSVAKRKECKDTSGKESF